MYHYLKGLSFYEKRNILLEMLLKNVGIGDKERSTMHLNKLICLLDELPSEKRLEEIKLLGFELNILLRHLSHTYKVHGHYSEELYQSLRKKITDSIHFSQMKILLSNMMENYLQLIRECSRRQYSDIIRGCLDYIDFHFSEPITLSLLASHFSVTDSYLSARFTQETGKTLVTYITSVRIGYACTLLEKLQISIQKVAELCGFSSSNYFSRVFHQQMGLSPTEFRRQRQKNICYN